MLYKIALPKLFYGFSDLSPFLSEEQLRIHYEKHHQAYVNGTNTILEKLDKARQESGQLDMKSELKSLSFNLSGHILHTLFWENLAPAGEGGGGEPNSVLLEKIKSEFGSLQRFKEEFTQAALSVEGSGWAALIMVGDEKKLLISQIEKHSLNNIPESKILLIIDVFEHAYYLDYKNERVKYIESFWNAINWSRVSERLKV
jgi:superoxide dismutase, Fe-Mn family